MRPLFSFLSISLAFVLGRLQSSLAVPNSPLNANAPKLKDSIPYPRHWIDLGRAPPTEFITLRIGLPQARFAELERQLYEISDPDHERYGQYLMKEQVDDLVRPDPRSVEAVDAWLAEYGISEGKRIQRSRAGDWVTIFVPVRQAEEMLHTEFHRWKHTRDGIVLIRTTHYSLPEQLHEHIELVQPTTYFGRPKPMNTNLHIDVLGFPITIFPSPPPPPPGILMDPRLGVNCTSVMTVWCLQQLYNTARYKPVATGKNKIGITGYLDEFANMADLQSFYIAERPDAENSSFQTVLVNGGQNDQTLYNAGFEASLDTQFGFGLSYPTPGTFYSVGGSPPSFSPDDLTPDNTNEPYDDWLQFMLSLGDDIPQTISTSYSDDEQTVPEEYAVRVCKEFATLGCRGASIIFSSGDSGVGDGDPDPATQQCITNDGTNQTKFIPHFPPSCPFVTAVGGTSGIPEVAAPFSGGGFSNYFARPKYQNDTVNKYLAGLPDGLYEGYYNPAGRAYPDVSAQSQRFLIYCQGEAVLISGTSASAPTFAAIVALLNDAMLGAGRPPLGFLNPLLYSKGAAGFNDITAGNAPGCGTPGFNATKGWDPVTGLGTPDFQKLKNIFLGWPLTNLLSGLLGIATLSLSVSVDLTVKVL